MKSSRAPSCANTWPAIADVEIVAECANGFEAVKAVSDLQPDLLILDVQMPKLNGFEVLELVGHDVAVVFVTAYDQYAIRAFEVHAVDYLLKPFGADRLAAAIDRVRERLGRGETLPVAGARADGSAGAGARAADPRARRPARPRAAGREDRLRAGAGRLRVLPLRREGVPEGADARPRSRRRSTRRSSCGFTDRTC